MFIYILFVTNHITSLEKRIKYQYDSLWFNKLKIHGLSMAQSHLTVLQIVGTMDMNSSSRSHSRQTDGKMHVFLFEKAHAGIEERDD